MTTFGIIGGSGMLGRAIALGLLKSGTVAPDRLWISNRSGEDHSLNDHPGVTFTTDNQRLADACDTILLCVPPALKDQISITAPDKLILSVMAGLTRDQMTALTGANRVVRAMSSPAAEAGLAYSPWCPGADVTTKDQQLVRQLLSGIGTQDMLADEDHITLFTALTGPVPGFAAFFAECLADYATAQGVDATVADRATRQLFLAAGQMMAHGTATPSDHVQAMIDYAGTTAAGLTDMRSSDIKAQIARGLDAAVQRTRDIG